MVLEKIIIPEIQKVSGQVEKKICAVGITKILTECPPMMDTEYTKLWYVNTSSSSVRLFVFLKMWPIIKRQWSLCEECDFFRPAIVTRLSFRLFIPLSFFSK